MDTSTAPLVPVQPDFPPNAITDASANPLATNPPPSFAQVMLAQLAPRSVLRWEEQGMTIMIERRRNAIVREIARYRTEFSQQAQHAIEVAAAPGGAACGSAA